METVTKRLSILASSDEFADRFAREYPMPDLPLGWRFSSVFVGHFGNLSIPDQHLAS